MDPQSKEWIVVDAGSHTTKAGIGGNDEPSLQIPSLVESGFQPAFIPRLSRPRYVGQHMLYEIDQLDSIRPIGGHILDFDAWQSLMEFCFSQGLQKAPEGQCLFLAEPYLCSRVQREKCLQIAMETWNFASYSAASTPCLSLYAEGETAGMICDLGEQQTKVVAVIEGYGMPHATTEFGNFGAEATEALQALFLSRGVSFPLKSQMTELERAKEQCSFIRPIDANAPLPSRKSPQYTTKDRQVLDLGDKWDFMTNLIFNPLINKSLPELFYLTASRCFAEQRDLFGNIKLTGGGSRIPGLTERLQAELQQLTSYRVRVQTSSSPRASPWMGMSILTTLSSFEQMVINNSEYEEIGPSLIHRKCYI
jgi:actin beta/gamma 1